MARFLCAATPMPGHINPLVSVAKALQARGHEVAFYTRESRRRLLEEEGLGVFPFGDSFEARIQEGNDDAAAPRATQRHVALSLYIALQNLMVDSIPDQLVDLQAILQDWRPDAILSDVLMWGPFLLWEMTRVPVAFMTPTMSSLIPGPDAPLGPGLPPPKGPGGRMLARIIALALTALTRGPARRLDRIRTSQGLPPLGCGLSSSLGRLPLFLVPSVPELDYNRRDLPPSVRYVGPCIWNKPSGEPPPHWLEALPPDLPWVHVTEGTVHVQDPFLLRGAARGLGGLPMEVILTSGSLRAPEALELGPLAPNVRLERWVSHSDLLPRCAAVVTTGGAGTVMASLQAGVPMVIVPTGWDKPDNAQRVVDAGAGLRLEPHRCSPARLRAAVERVLREPGFRENARRISKQLANAGGPPRAASLLESLAVKPAECASEVVGQSSAQPREAARN